jgi:hypothetical protein
MIKIEVPFCGINLDPDLSSLKLRRKVYAKDPNEPKTSEKYKIWFD